LVQEEMQLFWILMQQGMRKPDHW